MTSFKLDAPLLVQNLAAVPQRARDIAERGFDGTFTFEGPHEPFMPLLLAAEHSSLEIATGVAIAFARTPMTAANLAWDLQHFSQGRFTLGLGSQVKPHVEARYSMPWGKPVSRMREFVQAGTVRISLGPDAPPGYPMGSGGIGGGRELRLDLRVLQAAELFVGVVDDVELFENLLAIERFAQIVIHAFCYTQIAITGSGMRGQCDDRRVFHSQGRIGFHFADFFRGFKTIHARHLAIHENDIERGFFGFLNRGKPIRCQ